MEYLSVHETALRWGISDRLVQRYCSQGRIDGVRKFGGSWGIPADACKPADPRRSVPAAPTPAPAGGQPVSDQPAPAAAAPTADRSMPAAAPSDRPAPATPADAALDRTHTPVPQTLQPPRRPSGACSNLMPLMNAPFEPGRCREFVESLEDGSRKGIARAEYAYFSGRADEAAELAGVYLGDADPAIRLSACLISAFANLALGEIARARFALEGARGTFAGPQDTAPLAPAPRASAPAGATSLASVPLEAPSPEMRAMGAFVAQAASALLHLPEPAGLPQAREVLPLLPPGLRCFALYVHAHRLYLQGEYDQSLGLVLGVFAMQDVVYPIPFIYLHLVAVMDLMSLRRADEARAHLLAAWDIARPDDLIEGFGEHHGLLGGMLEAAIKPAWPEDFKRIIDITYRFSAGWRRVHNPDAGDVVADNLTTTEFAASMLAARGWTNAEIAEHMGVSPNTVKSYISSSLQKLGISRRQDLGRFMLS